MWVGSHLSLYMLSMRRELMADTSSLKSWLPSRPPLHVTNSIFEGLFFSFFFFLFAAPKEGRRQSNGLQGIIADNKCHGVE